jgi:hypothetical protein
LTASRQTESPNIAEYSRLNCDELRYPTLKAASKPLTEELVCKAHRVTVISSNSKKPKEIEATD